MRSFKRNLFLGTILVGALVLPNSLAVANAGVEDGLDELVRLNPGTSRAEMKLSAEEYAKRFGMSVERIVEEALVKARAVGVVTQNSADEEVTQNSTDGQKLSSSSSAGSDDELIKESKWRGDVFYSPSITGHVGIFGQTNEIVEAPGAGHEARRISTRRLKVGTGTRIQEVKISVAQQAKAAEWSYRYVGRKYNKNFAFNKSINADSGRVNCSQLVWASYMGAVGVDLDGDGGFGVYPRDIANSSDLTKTYRTV